MKLLNRKCSYFVMKESKELWFVNIFNTNRAKRISFYNRVIRDRVFDRNMINGLCYGEFYGRQKIIFKRKKLF